MNLAKAETLAKELMALHMSGLGYSFEWNNRKRAAGLCDYTKKTIELSIPCVSGMSEDKVKGIILHEIAHALTPGAGHGPVWKAKCREIGYEPSRLTILNDEEMPEPKYVLCFGSEIIERYYRKPTAIFRKINNLFISGRRSETLGKLEIMSMFMYNKIYN